MTKKRIIAIGDVHGNFDLLKKLVESEIRFKPQEDTLIFLGDYIDRGLQSREVIKYLAKLQHVNPDSVILLKGNHESACEDYLNGIDTATWLDKSIGGRATIESFKGIESVRKILLPFIARLKMYAETEDHIFVHGGIPFGLKLEDATEYDLVWERENRFYRGEKTLVVGHTPVPRVTLYPNKVINVDTGAFYTGILSAYDTKSGKVYEAFSIGRSDIATLPKIEKPITGEWTYSLAPLVYGDTGVPVEAGESIPEADAK